MKKLIIAVLLLVSVVGYSRLYRQVTVSSTSQSLTSTMTDYGSAIQTQNYDDVAIWVDYTSHNSLGASSLQVVGCLDSTCTTEYVLPIETSSSDKVDLDDERYVFPQEDYSGVIGVNANGTFPYIKIKVSAHTPSNQTSNPSIDSVYLTGGIRGGQR